MQRCRKLTIQTASVVLSHDGPPIMRTRQSLPIRLPYEFATSVNSWVYPQLQGERLLVMSRDPGVEPDPHYPPWPKTPSGTGC
jgi:hypothetical protein